MTIRKFLTIEVFIAVALSLFATLLTLLWSPHDPGEGFSRLNMLFYVVLEDIFVITFLWRLLGEQSENRNDQDIAAQKMSFPQNIYGFVALFGAILVLTILYIIARVSQTIEFYSNLYS